MNRVLVANRGEIASRIIRTCEKMGIETVAVYSDADQQMPYVQQATLSVRIGEAPVQKSYLNANRMIQVAVQTNADAIHPGYGFLSENARFARAVQDAGLTFIGPSPETIAQMGDKLFARRIMKQAGVPVVPGSDEELTSLEEALEAARTIGYPVMLKASGGGGGIGMVICETEERLKESYATTKTRAKSYFGVETVFVEKYIKHAHHIEVQIFGDLHGQIVHLFERECSIQRRHQKVIEETPSPFLTNHARDRLFKLAILAAETVGYVNAGTVEFILDEQENIYFLEMNTRLQVEHPITECVTNTDLVEWQLRVARGERLPKRQEEIVTSGHAMQFRLYAEHPFTFMPSPGVIEVMELKEREHVRIDPGYQSGVAVTPFYDPLIAKCIVHAQTRETVMREATQFFQEVQIEGIQTNLLLFERILGEEQFGRGVYNTNYLKNNLSFLKEGF